MSKPSDEGEQVRVRIREKPMDLEFETESKAATPALPSLGRLLIFAVLIPAAVAASNQLFFQLALFGYARGGLLYPWIAFTTAVLSWCTGRYLQPTWLGWIVFAWCLVLLDLLTIAACLSGPVPENFAFVLISSQISLLVIWSILARVGWQWRLPGLGAFGAAVVVFAGNFVSNWRMRSWGILMIATTIVVLIICCGLRLRGFSLRQLNPGNADATQRSSAHQFGTRHMLVWAAAIGPVLLVARGMEFVIFSDFNVATALRSIWLSLGIAMLNLVVIWAVLGAGPWPIRIAALMLLPFVLALGLEHYTLSLRPGLGQNWTPFFRMLRDMEGAWGTWLWLNAALLAALLLFVRANGYRLLRANPTDQLDE